MRIRLLAAGTRLPAWETQGFETYAKRLPRECRLELVEIPVAKRTKHTDTARAIAAEGDAMIKALTKNDWVVALDVAGKQWSSPELALQLERWLGAGSNVALLIGGPDGLAQPCFARAQQRWSLAKLTLPHGLARVVVAEQLYRAWSIVNGHPYHRA